MFSGMKFYIYAAITIAIASSIGYFLYDWHYSVISDCKEQVVIHERTIQSQETTIHNLGTQIKEIVESNRVQNFEEYFKGFGDANNTTVSDKFIF